MGLFLLPCATYQYISDTRRLNSVYEMSVVLVLLDSDDIFPIFYLKYWFNFAGKAMHSFGYDIMITLTQSLCLLLTKYSNQAIDGIRNKLSHLGFYGRPA